MLVGMSDDNQATLKHSACSQLFYITCAGVTTSFRRRLLLLLLLLLPLLVLLAVPPPPPRGWVHADAEIKVRSAENPNLSKMFCLKASRLESRAVHTCVALCPEFDRSNFNLFCSFSFIEQ